MFRNDPNGVETTAGEVFSGENTELMALLIYKRFGRDQEAATAAWRRLLGNSATTDDFMKLVYACDIDL